MVIAARGPVLALAWDAIADQALAQHLDKLVIVCPSGAMARTFWGDLASEVPVLPQRALCVTAAGQWRGSRSDHPLAFLVCIRHPDGAAAGPDLVRYRAFMEANGQRPIL